MIINNFNSVLKKTLLFSMLFFSVTTLNAQLTGTKNIPGDYASLDLAIADLNTQGVGPGGVVLNLISSNPQTAPLGGYVIGGAGSLVLTSANATNTITITGNSNIITAPSSQVSGQLFDGIFKLVGADYVTIQGFTLNENAANTTTAAATNNMTEWGIALLYASLTDGCQNISLLNNTIALGATYQNAMGIYSNSTHSATTIATSATATGLTGGNHNLSIKGNTISNVNHGIVVVGPTAAVDMNNNVSIGGTTPAEGNTITYGLTGTFSGYANVSGTVNGILVRNSINATVSNNSLTSNGTVTAGTLNGIQFPGFSTTPTGTFTQNINNNTLAIRSNAVAGNVVGITQPSGSATVTSICNINNNNFANFGHTIAAASGTLTFISTASTHFTTNINTNTFTNISVNTTGSVTFISHSYTMPANGTKSVSNNAIVTGFTKTGAGGTVTFMTTGTSSPNSASGVYSNNTISNVTLTGATTFTAITDTDGSGSAANKIFNGNTISNINGGTSTITGITCTYWGGTSSSISNNTLSNINGQGTITGINLGSTFNGATNSVLNANSITGLTSSGAGGAVTGISCSNTSTGILITNSTINGLSSTGASAVNGISISGSTSTAVVANKIHSLSSSNAGGSVNGILVSAGTLSTLTNNVIGNLTASVANAANPINGINITGGTAVNAFYNSVYLNATSTGALFGSSAISVSTTPTVTLRNNIFINESSFTGAGFSVAVRRSSTTLTSYSAASNNNLLYSGTPSANNLVMYDGTNSYSTLLAYQTAVLPRDANSITGEAAFTASGYGTAGNFFISLTPSSADYLKPVAGITTQAESGAQNISGITTDYSVATRAGNAGYSGTGSNPDMGAFEFEGVSPAPVITLNTVTPSTSSQCVVSSRLISVNATTLSGTITAVNIGYSINGTPQANIPMTNTSGSTWEGTIPAPTPANATIAWGVSATNSLGLSSSLLGTSYSDEPLTGVTANASSTISTVCSGNPTNLSTTLSKSGSSVSGAGTGTSSLSGISPFYHGYGGVKTQYIYRASELTAMGFTAGNFSSISLNITTLGTPTLNSFTINVGHTAQNAAVTNTAILSGLTEVYNSAAQVLVSGANVFTFTTPFTWDGTSNIVLSFNYSNVNTGGTSSTVTTDPALAFTSSLAIYADNASGACLFTAPASGQACMGTNSNTTSSTRPTITFTGNKSPIITSVTWSDGATTVGTGNPLTVNPTVTTTYTASITSAGCTVSPAPTVTVTVNPLPTAPTASNSAQCGTQIPTASVTSTSGLSSPTFKWYDAAVGGTVLQNSTSTTYTSNVASTTTFYVAELNSTTGCESARTAVTVTVATADGILASANNTSICAGSSVNLSVVNTNPTPNQNYSYTWTNAATGSGLVSQTGASITVTPTQVGTYTYTVAGVDGGCNAISTVNVTVNPYTATLTPINITCFGANNGSFSVATQTCGTADTYSVDGGSFGPIPTNLTPGAHTVIVKNTLGFETSSISLTITEPAAVIIPAGISNATVCQNATSAQLSVPTTATITVPVTFGLAAQPTVIGTSTAPTTVAGNPNVIATATLPALPTGASISSVTFTMNGLTPTGGSWGSDVFFGFSGAYSANYASGTGAPGSTAAFNYTKVFTGGTYNPAGGTVELNYYDQYDDNAGAAECTFPTGSSVGTLTIVYTVNNPTVNWYSATTGGSLLGTGTPFETVGTSVLPSTATPGTYNFYAEGVNGSCVSASRTLVTVTVNANPSTNAGADQTVCSGTAVTLTGSGANTYSWNNSVTNGVAFTPATTTTYTVTGTSANGCTATDQVVVTVNTSPTVNAGVDQTVCSGTSVTLAGSGANTYTWNNSVTDGVAFTPAATATYTVIGTAANGCTAADIAIVTVNTTPTVNAGVDQTVCAGTTVTLSGSGASTYSWNNSVTNATAFTPATTATYTVSGTAANGCTATDQAVVTVNALPTVNAGADQTVCVGSSVTLVGSGATTYTWNNSVVDATAFTPAATATYTVTGTDANGCQNTDQVDVTVNSLPTVNAGADQTVCAGTSVTLTGSGASTYSWNNSVVDATAFTPAATATYIVTGTDVNGCQNTDQVDVTVNSLPTVNAGADQTVCAGTSVTLAGSGASTYSWNNSVVDATAFTPAATATYTVTGTGANGCQNTDQVNVTVNSLPTVNAGADQTVCAGTSVTLAGSGASTYSWDNSVIDATTFTPAATATYTVTGTDANGCQNTDQVDVTVNTLPIVNAGADQSVCAGTSVTLAGSGASTYSWDNGVTDAVAFTPASTVTYTVTGTDANGCENTDQVSVAVNSIPVATATDNGDATITAGTATSYQWIDCATGLAIAGATSQTYTVTANGTYAVIESNGSCSDTSACVTIDYMKVSEMAIDAIGIYPNPTRDNVTVTMTNASASIEVIDAQGKLLQASHVVNGDKIDLSTYETGMYIFRVTTENGTSIFRVSKN